MLSHSNSACSSRTPISAIRTNSTPFVAVLCIPLSRRHTWLEHACPRPRFAFYAWWAVASIPHVGSGAVETLPPRAGAQPDRAFAGGKRIERRETAQVPHDGPAGLRNVSAVSDWSYRRNPASSRSAAARVGPLHAPTS